MPSFMLALYSSSRNGAGKWHPGTTRSRYGEVAGRAFVERERERERESVCHCRTGPVLAKPSALVEEGDDCRT